MVTRDFSGGDVYKVLVNVGGFQLALKSGTVTPSGGFTAHPDGFEAELTDKPLPQRAKSVD